MSDEVPEFRAQGSDPDARSAEALQFIAARMAGIERQLINLVAQAKRVAAAAAP